MKKIAAFLLGATTLASCGHGHYDDRDDTPTPDPYYERSDADEDSDSADDDQDSENQPADASEGDVEVTTDVDTTVLSDDEDADVSPPSSAGGDDSTTPDDDTPSDSTGDDENIDAAPADPEPVVQEVNTSVTYGSPGGDNTVQFSIVATDGVITRASVTPVGGEDDTSAGYISRFQGGLGSVVGRTVAQAEANNAVGGASLTTSAFKQALAQL